MTLDVRSILLTSMAVSLILTAMMLVYRLTRKVYAGFTHWLLGDVFITLGFLLLALRGVVSDFISVILGNVFLILALVVLYQGIRRFFGQVSQDKANILTLVLFTLSYLYLVYVDENVDMRIVISSFVLTFLMFRSGEVLLFKAPDFLKRSAMPGGVVMWATGIFFFVRGIDAIINWGAYDIFSTNWINVVGYMMGAVLVSSWTFGFFFLNSTRLELELQEVQEELKKLALTDSLTGIFNRRHFFEHASVEFQRAVRYKRAISILMIDLDEFKAINDRHGHAAGDKALKLIVEIVGSNMRSIDTFARLGGEEFAVLIAEADQKSAMQTAERIRKQVANVNVPFDGQQIPITISIGVAALQNTDTTFEEILRRADNALYRAKQKGRNQISD